MIAVAIGLIALVLEVWHRAVVRAFIRRVAFQREGNRKLIEMNTQLLRHVGDLHRENADLVRTLERRK